MVGNLLLSRNYLIKTNLLISDYVIHDYIILIRYINVLIYLIIC